MSKPFDIVVVGTIAETIAKGLAQGCELQSFFLFGGCGQHIQRQEGGWGKRIDLGDRYLATKFDDLFQELFNIRWKIEISQRGRAA